MQTNSQIGAPVTDAPLQNTLTHPASSYLGQIRLIYINDTYNIMHTERIVMYLHVNIYGSWKPLSDTFRVWRGSHPEIMKPNMTAAQEIHIAENISERLLRSTWKAPNIVKTVKQKQQICNGSWRQRDGRDSFTLWKRNPWLWFMEPWYNTTVSYPILTTVGWNYS